MLEQDKCRMVINVDLRIGSANEIQTKRKNITISRHSFSNENNKIITISIQYFYFTVLLNTKQLLNKRI